jgi:acyl carrier protein
MNINQKKLEQIEIIFRKVFNDENLKIDFETNSDSIVGWDSITNIMLIDLIEETFQIEFPVEVIFESKNIGDWINFILSNSND